MALDFEAAFKKDDPAEMEIVEQTPFDSNMLDVLLNVEAAKGNFLVLKNQMGEMTKKAQGLKVEDAKSNKTANEMLIQCRQVEKAVNKIKATMPEYVKAATFKNSMDKYIRELFTNTLTQISNKILAPKINQFQKAEAELQRKIAKKKADEAAIELQKQIEADNKKQAEADALALKEHEARQAKLDAEAAAAGVEAVKLDEPIKTEALTSMATPAIAPVLEVPETKIQTEAGTSTIKSEWAYKIIDAGQVPREYCSPDDKLLKAAVKAGIRTIAGCEIVEEFKSAVRVKSK